MDIDISNNVSSMKKQVPASNYKPEAQDIRAPQRNDEIAKKAEDVKHKAMSIEKVEMSYDSSIDRIIITVVDGRSLEIVQQIPAQDSVNFMKRFQQSIKKTLNLKA